MVYFYFSTKLYKSTAKCALNNQSKQKQIDMFTYNILVTYSEQSGIVKLSHCSQKRMDYDV